MPFAFVETMPFAISIIFPRHIVKKAIAALWQNVAYFLPFSNVKLKTWVESIITFP